MIKRTKWMLADVIRLKRYPVRDIKIIYGIRRQDETAYWICQDSGNTDICDVPESETEESVSSEDDQYILSINEKFRKL